MECHLDYLRCILGSCRAVTRAIIGKVCEVIRSTVRNYMNIYTHTNYCTSYGPDLAKLSKIVHW